MVHVKKALIQFWTSRKYLFTLLIMTKKILIYPFDNDQENTYLPF